MGVPDEAIVRLLTGPFASFDWAGVSCPLPRAAYEQHGYLRVTFRRGRRECDALLSPALVRPAVLERFGQALARHAAHALAEPDRACLTGARAAS